MGHRAIRYCLGEEDIFKTQLKAILRAGADHNVKIMLPLVTTLCEIKAAKAAIDRAKEELRRENKRFSDSVPVGIMVETPAAAVMADIFAEHVDFFSIGTNDLTQYTMAADRGNSRVSELYSPFDPAVLRLIKSVVASAKRAGIPAGMCGEAAADPLLIPLLLSFGLDEFSVSPSSVLKTRKIISEWHKKDADALAQRVMSLSTADEIKAALAAAAEQRRG